MTEKQLIYAVDDEENIRDLYSAALDNAGFTSQCFTCGEELFVALNNKIPSLILLDIMLDGIDGFKILEKLKSDIKYKNIPVIMVSAKGEEISKVKGLNLGADDYISKPFGVLELIARINANTRKFSGQKTSKFLDITIDEGTHEIKLNDTVMPLALKEYDLLRLLISRSPNVITREEIFNIVWGEDYFGETRTLDIHIAQLRKYLAESKAQILTIRGVGYCIK